MQFEQSTTFVGEEGPQGIDPESRSERQHDEIGRRDAGDSRRQLVERGDAE